jgi:hypothetical protein
VTEHDHSHYSVVSRSSSSTHVSNNDDKESSSPLTNKKEHKLTVAELMDDNDVELVHTDSVEYGEEADTEDVVIIYVDTPAPAPAKKAAYAETEGPTGK